MPTGATLTPSKPGAAPSAPVMTNPFTRAARQTLEGAFHDKSAQQLVAGSTFQVTDIDVPSFGYARSILILVQATGGVGATTTAAKEDAPWIALTNIIFADTNGQALVGPISGFDLYLANKWGAYGFMPDPQLAPEFVFTLGANASGNFTFILRIPLEVGERDGLCALPNMNAASAFKVTYSINDSAKIYSTAPSTTLPALRVRMYLESWSQPDPADARGVANQTQPPMSGSTQHWSKTIFNLPAGDARLRLPRMGNMIRTLVCTFRSATPARDTVDFPDPLRLEFDSKLVFAGAQQLFKRYMWERSGLVLGAFDTGVFVIDFSHDFDGSHGWELRDQWLPTTPATRLELVGTFNVAGTLEVLTNDVALTGGAQLPNG